MSSKTGVLVVFGFSLADFQLFWSEIGCCLYHNVYIVTIVDNLYYNEFSFNTDTWTKINTIKIILDKILNTTAYFYRHTYIQQNMNAAFRIGKELEQVFDL